MVNILGNQQIYTVPEIKALMEKVSRPFLVTDTLPDLADAKDNVVYYIKTGKTNKHGYPLYIAYFVVDDGMNHREWATSGGGIESYNELEDKPYYRKLETDTDDTIFEDNVTDILAQPISSNDIIEIVNA